MNDTALSRFESFAAAFVRKYWQTVKTGAFPLPPDEPFEKSIEELLADISHQTEFRPASGHGGPLYVLRMTNAQGDWWQFIFRESGLAWELVGASARSDSGTPHDLLGPVYSRYFEPFLRHVERVANDAKSI
jgi:hypothetical protein